MPPANAQSFGWGQGAPPGPHPRHLGLRQRAHLRDGPDLAQVQPGQAQKQRSSKAGVSLQHQPPIQVQLKFQFCLGLISKDSLCYVCSMLRLDHKRIKKTSKLS